MAKIRPLEIISSMSGKVCMHSDMYFRTNTMNNTVSTGKICFPSTKPATEDQIQAKNRFKAVVAAVRARIAALETDAKAALKKAAKAARAGSVFGYAFQKWNNEYDETGSLITTPSDGE